MPLSAAKKKKNIVDMIAPSVLIGSSSKLQVARISIKSWISSIFGQIKLFASELHASSIKLFFPQTYNGEKKNIFDLLGMLDLR